MNNLSREALEQMEAGVTAGDTKAINMVKSMRANINAARKNHGLPPFVTNTNGDLIVEGADN